MMKTLRLSLCLILAITLGHNAYAGSPYTKVTTVGTTGRDGAIMFAIGPDFYIGGGGSSKDFWVFHSDLNTLAKLPDIPGSTSSRSFATAFAIGNKGYICLGEDVGTTTTLKNDLWAFDPVTVTWTRKADFIGSPRDGAFVFVVGNTCYIGGGSNDSILYNDFFAYNAATNQWTQKGILPTGYTIFPAAFTLNNIGYITTGQSGQTETNALYKYDTTADDWTQMSDFPGAARQTAVAMVVDNKAYVGLGMSQYTTQYNDFYEYDPAHDQWAKITTSTGGTRAWSCAASNGTKAYFAFGWDLGSNFYNDLWNFDPSQATGIESAKPALTGVSIYPDPTQGYLYLSTPNNINIKSLEINDISGRSLKTVYPEGSIDYLKIDSSGLASGVYFLNINSGQAVDCKKFVVE